MRATDFKGMIDMGEVLLAEHDAKALIAALEKRMSADRMGKAEHLYEELKDNLS